MLLDQRTQGKLKHLFAAERAPHQPGGCTHPRPLRDDLRYVLEGDLRLRALFLPHGELLLAYLAIGADVPVQGCSRDP